MKPRPKRPKPKTQARPKPESRWQVIGKRIRDDREAKGMSQAELARRLDLTSMTAWRYEDGRIRIPLATLERIAQILEQPATRYLPTHERPQQALTAAEQHEIHMRFAALAIEAATKQTDEAREAFNEAVAEHYWRTRT